VGLTISDPFIILTSDCFLVFDEPIVRAKDTNYDEEKEAGEVAMQELK
jgi:hypothetical protein